MPRGVFSARLSRGLLTLAPPTLWHKLNLQQLPFLPSKAPKLRVPSSLKAENPEARGKVAPAPDLQESAVTAEDTLEKVGWEWRGPSATGANHTGL